MNIGKLNMLSDAYVLNVLFRIGKLRCAYAIIQPSLKISFVQFGMNIAIHKWLIIITWDGR